MDKRGLWELFKKDPEAALEAVLVDGENSLSKIPFISTSIAGIDGQQYVSSKLVPRSMLTGRKYEISLDSSWTLNLHFTDKLYDPRTFKVVEKGKDNNGQDSRH